MTPREYLDRIVKPTVSEYETTPTDVRRGFLAALVLTHMVDAQFESQTKTKKREELREQYESKSPELRILRDVANCLKHIKPSSAKLVTDIDKVGERPPALAGRMMCGISMLGDYWGGLVAEANGNWIHLDSQIAACMKFWESECT
jgi:hypothetical protein